MQVFTSTSSFILTGGNNKERVTNQSQLLGRKATTEAGPDTGGLSFRGDALEALTIQFQRWGLICDSQSWAGRYPSQVFLYVLLSDITRWDGRLSGRC